MALDFSSKEEKFRCPECGSPMTNKGWGIACTNFPNCVRTIENGLWSHWHNFKPRVLPDPSHYQQAILDAVPTGDPLMVISGAGSGKTTLAEMIGYSLPKGTKWAYCCYNTSIRAEAEWKMPPGGNVRTIHQIAYGPLRAELQYKRRGRREMKVDADKVFRLACEVIEERHLEEWSLLSSVVSITDKHKNTVKPATLENFDKTRKQYGVYLKDEQVIPAYEIFAEVMKRNDECRHRMGNIWLDFSDMLRWVIMDNYKLPKYDVLIADEVQDFSSLRLDIAEMITGGQTIMIGDPNQSIYGFSGAFVDAMDRIKDRFGSVVYPLSVSYRCAKSHVRFVNQYFKDIPLEEFEGNPEGSVEFTDIIGLFNTVQPKDRILGRTNAMLFQTALELMAEGKKVTILGRAFGKQVIAFIKALKGETKAELIAELDFYQKELIPSLLEEKRKAEAFNLTEAVTIARYLLKGCWTREDMAEKIERVFSDTEDGIVLSTVHKAKGLEAKNVFIINPEAIPHPLAVQDWELVQEVKLAYVASTRAKSRLAFVSGSGYDGFGFMDEVITSVPQFRPGEVDIITLGD